MSHSAKKYYYLKTNTNFQMQPLKHASLFRIKKVFFNFLAMMETS